jgi:hypothetical protein
VLSNLERMVHFDSDRYNRYYALVALRRLGTPAATNCLLDALFTSRLDPVTIQGNLA